MPDGGSLTIETASTNIDESYAAKRPEASAGKAAVLTVTDTGHGMDEQTIEHIFEPFYTTKGLTKGTGLGLATVYAIVQQSRGWISVQSKPGAGSVFQIYLPSIEGDDLAETTAVPQGAQLRGSETVLVVEDEVDVRTFAVSALEAYGYRVLDACDGAQALGLSGHFRDNIDVLLTDVVMPGINGRELAERFKSARPGIAILYTSGYTDDVIAHRGVLDASVAYLPKPYTAGDLVAKVREVLKERAER